MNKCEHETSTIDYGRSIKSYCDLWQRWTNCRDVGHCVYEEAKDLEKIIESEVEDG